MTRQQGFSMIELVMSMAIFGTLLSSLYVVSTVAVGQTSTQQEKQASLGDAHRALAQIETAVRLSDRIVKAGVDRLVLETRYFIDTDDGVEEVRYIRSGNSLYRRVSDEGGALSEPLLILDDATAFQAHKLTIRENFDREDFDSTVAGVIPVGDTITADSSVQAEYDLRAMGDIDPDLLTAYSVEKERVEATGTSAVAPTTMTLTPPLKKRSLTATTDFTPQSVFKEYRPLVWGDAAPDTNNISVIFKSDGKIMLRTTQGGTLVDEATSGATWAMANAYKVRLEMMGDKARAFVSANGEPPQKVGIIDNGTMTTGALHYQINGTGNGAWDSLEVDYRFLNLTLTTTLNGKSVQLWGGACSRQPE